MSAYFVTTDTASAAVEIICRAEGIQLDHAAKSRLGRDLLTLNVMALACRYGHQTMDNMDVPDMIQTILNHEHNSMVIDLPEVVLLKSAECMAYQCAEGEATEHSLLARLDAATSKVSDRKKPAGWDDAPWGLDAGDVERLVE